jgi:protein SCO1/2
MALAAAQSHGSRPSSSPPEEPAPCCVRPNAGDSIAASAAKTEGNSSARSPWLEPGERGSAGALNLRVTDQDGMPLNLDDFRGRPVALSFVYTRCTNANKCPLVAARMADLQTRLEREGLASRVQLALVTYDPDYDTPDRLKKYAMAHGLQSASQVRMLRPDKEAKEPFFDKLEVAVNYDGNDVNIHGLQLFLFDSQGRFVRCYRSVIWDNADVLADLKRLADEAS